MDLSKTREDFRRMKSENEELKVRNDTLFKLGNIALQSNKKNNKPEDPDLIEVCDDDSDEIESLESLARNKQEGFRRTGPASSST